MRIRSALSPLLYVAFAGCAAGESADTVAVNAVATHCFDLPGSRSGMTTSYRVEDGGRLAEAGAVGGGANHMRGSPFARVADARQQSRRHAANGTGGLRMRYSQRSCARGDPRVGPERPAQANVERILAIGPVRQVLTFRRPRQNGRYLSAQLVISLFGRNE